MMSGLIRLARVASVACAVTASGACWPQNAVSGSASPPAAVRDVEFRNGLQQGHLSFVCVSIDYQPCRHSGHELIDLEIFEVLIRMTSPA
jgi:hypothetical protein